MVSKAVKLSEENYKWLCEFAGNMQAEEKKITSIDEAVSEVRKRLSGKLSDLAGTWQMSDKEVKAFTTSLKRGWRRWTKSA